MACSASASGLSRGVGCVAATEDCADQELEMMAASCLYAAAGEGLAGGGSAACAGCDEARFGIVIGAPSGPAIVIDSIVAGDSTAMPIGLSGPSDQMLERFTSLKSVV